jgi:hypothetical protein
LTKEHIQTELASQNIDNSLHEKILEILNICEFARYAPNSGQQEMGNLYEDTIVTISELEQKFRKH